MSELIVNPRALTERAKVVLTPQVLNLLKTAHEKFNPERHKLLTDRKVRQSEFDRGAVPTYLSDHPAQKSQWMVAPIPEDCLDRRVEITGPVGNTKMVINMLNGSQEQGVANMAMLDFEDSMKPSWNNVIDGIHNVIGAIRGELEFKTKEKTYKLDSQNMAHPMVRVRGLHLEESNVKVDGTAISASIFDLVLCAAHSARLSLDRNQTPMYYVPKCEHFLEARWWNNLFRFVESEFALPAHSLRVTFLIETLTAAFQMEEILFEVRERALGLNGGRWDKIFSDIKVLKTHKDRVLADRETLDMTKPWMDNYAKRLIKICHRHGAFAMGGMSAFTPGKDEETRHRQMEKVRADKAREAAIGHDGCWVSHPFFIKMAQDQFKNNNQLHVKLEDFPEFPDLLPQGGGPKTIRGLRTNARVGIAYTRGWNEDTGCISLDGLMEDLATLEISRAQVWQWLHHRVQLDDGTPVTRGLLERIFDEESIKLTQEFGNTPEVCEQFEQAKKQTVDLFLNPDLPDFLTTRSETV